MVIFHGYVNVYQRVIWINMDKPPINWCRISSQLSKEIMENHQRIEFRPNFESKKTLKTGRRDIYNIEHTVVFLLWVYNIV